MAEYFPIEVKRAFGFGRSPNPVYGYKENWKSLFFTTYGKKNSKKGTPITDSYMRLAFDLALLRNYSGKSTYLSAEAIKSELGIADILYPLIPLSIAFIALSRAMSIKGDNLKSDADYGYLYLLKFFQYTFNLLLTIPLIAVALLTTLIWDVAKAIIAVVVATIGAIPLSFRKPSDYLPMEDPGQEKKVKNKKVEREKELSRMSLNMDDPRLSRSRDRQKMRNSFSELVDEEKKSPRGHGSPRINEFE